jgi:hypothetical protein
VGRRLTRLGMWDEVEDMVGMTWLGCGNEVEDNVDLGMGRAGD